MVKVDYHKICSDLISPLKEREKEVVLRRFGLKGKNPETLEAIGKDYGLSRERIRQIQKSAIEKIKPKLEKIQDVYQFFFDYLKRFGGLRREDILLEELGGQKEKNEVYFLLKLKEEFLRFPENEDFYSCWASDINFFEAAKKTINSVLAKLEEAKTPMAAEKLNSFSLGKEIFEAWLEISKKIKKNQEGLYGLKDWPEINPRRIRDKAYLFLKKKGKPLHFSEIAAFIEKANLHTVHNELIRDSRFVLVGRGIYALSEWGYFPGRVKDVIFKILKEEQKPLTKEEIIERVLKQRLVKENTILMNLSNKKYFLRDGQGRYRPKTELA